MVLCFSNVFRARVRYDASHSFMLNVWSSRPLSLDCIQQICTSSQFMYGSEHHSKGCSAGKCQVKVSHYKISLRVSINLGSYVYFHRQASDAGRSVSPPSDGGNASDDRTDFKGKTKAKGKRAGEISLPFLL